MNRVLSLILIVLSARAYGQDGYHAGIALSKDEGFFAVGNGGQDITLYRTRDGKRIRTFRDPEHAFYLTKPAFSPDGKFITAGSVAPDGGVNPVWRVSDGKVMARIGLRHGVNFTSTTPYTTIGFSPDGKQVLGGLFSFSGGQEYIAWNTNPWRHAFYLNLHDGPTITAVSPTAPLVVGLASEYRSFDSWNPNETGNPHWGHPLFVEFPAEIRYATFSGDGETVVMASDGWAARYRSSDENKGRDREPHLISKTNIVKDFIVRSVASNRDGSEAYLGSRDGRIARFDLRSNKVVKVWQAYREPVKGLALTKNGRLLAYDLKEVRMFSLEGLRLR